MIVPVIVNVPVAMTQMKYKNLSLKNKRFYYYDIPYVRSLLLDKNLDFLLENPNSIQSRLAMFFTRFANPPLYKAVKAFIEGKIIRKGALSTWIHLTDECTLRCSYCYLPHKKDRMSRETACKVVETLKNILLAEKENFTSLKVKISGGEALLNFDVLKELVKCLNSKIESVPKEIVVLSNGTIINDKVLKYLKNNDIKVMISLDGTAKYQDVHRVFPNGSGSFSIVKRSIDRLKENGIDTVLSSVLTSQTIKGLPSLLEFANSYDLPIGLNLVKTEDIDMQIRLDDFKKYWKKSLPEITKLAEKGRIMGNFVDQLILGYTKDLSCLAGNSYIVFYTDGSIYRCQHDYSKKSATIEDVDVMNKLREPVKGSWNPQKVDLINKCSNCEIRYFCSGGCPILRHNENGSLNGTEYCKIYRFVFTEILNVMDKI